MSTTNEPLYEKCRNCHLFVERNSSVSVAVAWDLIEDDEWQRLAAAQSLAAWDHLHRGDVADEALDESHPATPSGQHATLAVWKEFGPLAMRRRFDDYEHELSPHVLVTDDGGEAVITTHPTYIAALDCLRENFADGEDLDDLDVIQFVCDQGVLVYIQEVDDNTVVIEDIGWEAQEREREARKQV